MKKKTILRIVSSTFVIASIGFIFIYFQRNKRVDLLNTTISYEYGEVISLEGKNILDSEDESILQSFRVAYASLELEEGKDYPKVGNYELQIQYRVNEDDMTDTINIIVKDTKGPEFTKDSDKIEVRKGFDASELLSYFEATDVSPFEITMDTEKLDNTQIGEFEVEIVATDSYNNKSVRKAKLIVLEEELKNSKNLEHEASETNVSTYTVMEPRYENGIMIVNKKNPIPFDFAPYENEEAGNQARTLIKEMQTLGYDISKNYSGFRSFDTQAGLYKNYVNTYGQQEADTFSARPGYSEHQTGFAFDLLHQDGSLVEHNAEANWIAENAHRYGFIVRYQVGKEHITGYQAEPWHIRYIGPLAVDIYHSGLTLEEYLGIPGGSY